MDCKTNCKPGEVISGIRCDVVNCAHHREGDKCDAGCIQVGHGPCSSCSDTACETFKPRSSCDC